MRTHHPKKRRRRLATALTLGVVVLAAAAGARVAAALAASSRPAGAQVIRISTHRFDWGDAGIGAAGGIGLSMLAVGAGLLLRTTRRDVASPRRPTLKEQR